LETDFKIHIPFNPEEYAVAGYLGLATFPHDRNFYNLALQKKIRRLHSSSWVLSNRFIVSIYDFGMYCS
jgi:hypothetical protein